MWINRNERLPEKEKKYLVAIDCGGVQKEAYSSFCVNKKAFHFDMVHISWFVVGWFDAPDSPKYINFRVA